MLATADLFLKPVATGFIAVTPGRANAGNDAGNDTGSDTAVAERRSRAPAVDKATSVGHAEATTTIGFGERPTWESPAGAGVRRVEAAIVAGICAFFAFGLAGTLGLF